MGDAVVEDEIDSKDLVEEVRRAEALVRGMGLNESVEEDAADVVDG